MTLDGKLIDKSGTMSGGGKPKKGAMNLKFSSDVPGIVEKLEEER